MASCLLLSSCGEDDSVNPVEEGGVAILAIDPPAGRFGQEVFIRGRNFGTDNTSVEVFFNEEKARVVHLSDQEISVIVPAAATTGKVRVSVEEKSAESGSNFIVDNSDAIVLDANTRYGAASFVIDGKAYVGTGRVSLSTLEGDFWKFDPLTKSWTQLADFPGAARGSAFSFAIGSVGYIGGGDAGGDTDNMFAYDVTTNSWTEKAAYPNDWDNIHLTAVTIGGKAYVGFGGTNFSGSKSFYEYDPATDAWTFIGDSYPGPERSGSVSFVLDNKLYMGLGADADMQPLKDFYSYDPATGTWTRLADFAGEGKYKAVGFSFGSKGYVGTGMEIVSGKVRRSSDMWTYDPVADAWTKTHNYGSSPRYGMTAFVIGEDAYLGLGQSAAGGHNDFWIFRP